MSPRSGPALQGPVHSVKAPDLCYRLSPYVTDCHEVPAAWHGWARAWLTLCITSFEESRRNWSLNQDSQNATPARVQGPHMGEVSQAGTG